MAESEAAAHAVVDAAVQRLRQIAREKQVHRVAVSGPPPVFFEWIYEGVRKRVSDQRFQQKGMCSMRNFDFEFIIAFSISL